MTQLETVRFDYTGEGKISRHITNEVNDLAETAKTIQEFRDELSGRCDGKSFSELRQEWADYREVLFGGVKNGKYTERGIANAYKEIFGLQYLRKI